MNKDTRETDEFKAQFLVRSLMSRLLANQVEELVLLSQGAQQ